MNSKMLSLGLLLLLSGCHQEKPLVPNYKVPNKATAIKIAEAVWLSIYGKSIYEEKPFVAVLKNNTTWVVEGTLPPDMEGGTVYAEIDKKTGTITNVTHGK